MPVRETGAEGERDRLGLVPERDVGTSHDRVEWETFFDELDQGDQVVVYHGETADDPLEVTGQRDLVGRVDDDELEERLMEGETVTSEITETRVVESVVVEELTVESELVSTEQVEGRVVDAELEALSCPSCTLRQVPESDAREWFDTERYLDAIGGVEPMAATESGESSTDRTGSRTGSTTPTGTEPTRTDTETRTDAEMGTDTEMGRDAESTTRTDTEPPTTDTETTRTDTEPPTTDTETTRTDTETTRTDTETMQTDTEPARTDTEMGTESEVGRDATEDRTTSPGERTETPAGRAEASIDRSETSTDRPETAGTRRRELDVPTGPIDSEEFPYTADLEVEETWSVTREVVEQYVVESRVTDKEVTEADSIEDYDLEAAELHRSILDQELFETERPSDEVLAHYDVESELSDPDRIETTFTNERQVEDRIVDRKRLDATISGGDYAGMDLVESRMVGASTTGEGTATGTGTATDATTGEAGSARPKLTDDVVGNTVHNAAGDEIGMVSDVDESSDELFVDVQPGIAERIMATLGWSDADDEDYSLGVDAVRRIEDDDVFLKGREEIEDSAGDHV